MLPFQKAGIILSSQKDITRPYWFQRILRKNKYRWSFLHNYSFGSVDINIMDHESHILNWFLFERANHSFIDFDLGVHHIEWQKKLREQDIAYSFLAKNLNEFKTSIDFKYRPKENDRLLIYLHDVCNELVYEKGIWYIDNINSYRNAEWHCWLINSGDVIIKK